VAPLADGSRRKKQNVRNALHPFCFLRKDSITAGLFLNLIFYSILKHSQNQIPENHHSKYTKHNSKVTGLVAKADKGSLRQSQKIFLFLLQKPGAK
jgi:hypothetical protein